MEERTSLPWVSKTLKLPSSFIGKEIITFPDVGFGNKLICEDNSSLIPDVDVNIKTYVIQTESGAMNVYVPDVLYVSPFASQT